MEFLNLNERKKMYFVKKNFEAFCGFFSAESHETFANDTSERNS